MSMHQYNPQSASDAVISQAERINNVIPLLETGRFGLKPTADETDAARALLAHASELRTALSALENMAETVVFKADKRRETILDGFLQ
jgi:hypothetical protein